MHHRVSLAGAFAGWQLLQVHALPQPHSSPHWHDAAGSGAAFWQPHVHWAPAQIPHSQTFD